MSQSSTVSGQPSSDGWRRNLYVIWIATFTSLVGGQLAMPFIPLFIQRDLGVSDPGQAAIWAGLANAGTGVAMAIMAPIWGVLADRHGRKAMLVRAQFAIAASNSVSSLVVAPWQLVSIRAVQGGFSGVVGASRALVAGTVPRERVPYAMGMLQSAIYLGQTLGPAIGGIVGSVLGFRTALLATGGINTAAGILAALYVREAGGDRSRRRASPRASFGDILRSKPLAILVATQFLTSAATSSVRPVLPLLLAELDPTDDVVLIAGVAFAVLGVAGALASLGFGYTGSQIGLNRLLVLAALVGAVGNLAVSAATGSGAVLGLLFGIGFTQGLVASCATALLSLHAPAGRQGTTFGVLTSVQALAVGSGPLAGGLMASAIGLGSTFVMAASMLLLAAMVGWAVPPPPRSAARQDA